MTRLAISLVTAAMASGGATELTVLSAGAVESAVVRLGADFERASGHRVVVAFSTAPEIARRLASDAKPDVLIAPAGVVSQAAKLDRLLPDTQVAIARVGVGAAVRRGATLPALGSVDAMKEALLRADSVVYNEASTGQYLEQLFARMQILDRLAAKTTRYTSAADVLEHVIRGRGEEIGFGPITEIKDFEAKGVTLAGPLPREVQNYTTYHAVVTREARAADVARAFARYLATPAARDTFKATGAEAVDQ